MAMAPPLPAPETSAPPSTGVLAEAMRPFVDDRTIAGAVMLVGSRDEILDLETVGWSDLATKKPMAADALFWIASMTKAVTGAAVMVLVDEGKLSLDDPVEKYLPDFRKLVVADPNDPTAAPRPPAHPITLREVLSHSSGLPFKSSLEEFPLDRWPLSVTTASYALMPLLSQPGTAYSYSNAGINTAGRIIELVAGMPYETFLDERLFRPLGMNDTTFRPDAAQLRRLATAYQQVPESPYLKEVPFDQLSYPLDRREGRYPIPGGGLFSTAADVARFVRMLLNDGVCEGRRILSAGSVRAMATKQTAPAIEHAYGLGLDVAPDGSYSHGGAAKTYMGVDPGAGIYRVFMVHIQAPWLTDRGKNVLPAFIAATQAFGSGSGLSPAALSTEGQASR
jgi:CubicO group peptidase (beta-lactamase class C family)